MGERSKECLKIGNTGKEGMLYSIVLPEEIPLITDKIINKNLKSIDEDYFNAMLSLHYHLYLMTLTVNNIKGDNLSQEIKK